MHLSISVRFHKQTAINVKTLDNIKQKLINGMITKLFSHQNQIHYRYVELKTLMG